MFYYSINSRNRVVHFDGCSHINRIKDENLRSFQDAKSVRNSGYRVCSCCSPIMKSLRAEGSELEKYCCENGLQYSVFDGNLHINSVCSKWVITISDKRFGTELHHENLYNENYADSVPGYHNQKFSIDCILKYMKYIVKHDAYRQKHPIRVKKAKKAPRKGTKKYERYIKAEKKREKRRKVRNVLKLIDSLSLSA